MVAAAVAALAFLWQTGWLEQPGNRRLRRSRRACAAARVTAGAAAPEPAAPASPPPPRMSERAHELFGRTAWSSPTTSRGDRRHGQPGRAHAPPLLNGRWRRLPAGSSCRRRTDRPSSPPTTAPATRRSCWRGVDAAAAVKLYDACTRCCRALIATSVFQKVFPSPHGRGGRPAAGDAAAVVPAAGAAGGGQGTVPGAAVVRYEYPTRPSGAARGAEGPAARRPREPEAAEGQARATASGAVAARPRADAPAGRQSFLSGSTAPPGGDGRSARLR